MLTHQKHGFHPQVGGIAPAHTGRHYTTVPLRIWFPRAQVPPEIHRRASSPIYRGQSRIFLQGWRWCGRFSPACPNKTSGIGNQNRISRPASKDHLGGQDPMANLQRMVHVHNMYPLHLLHVSMVLMRLICLGNDFKHGSRDTSYIIQSRVY